MSVIHAHAPLPPTVRLLSRRRAGSSLPGAPVDLQVYGFPLCRKLTLSADLATCTQPAPPPPAHGVRADDSATGGRTSLAPRISPRPFLVRATTRGHALTRKAGLATRRRTLCAHLLRRRPACAHILLLPCILLSHAAPAAHTARAHGSFHASRSTELLVKLQRLKVSSS